MFMLAMEPVLVDMLPVLDMLVDVEWLAEDMFPALAPAEGSGVVLPVPLPPVMSKKVENTTPEGLFLGMKRIAYLMFEAKVTSGLNVKAIATPGLETPPKS